jgi:hypothetical protein
LSKQMQFYNHGWSTCQNSKRAVGAS